MNYFELFGLPIGFQVDTKQLRAAFMEIQRASHPNKFTQSNEFKQEEALEKSSIANKHLLYYRTQQLFYPMY